MISWNIERDRKVIFLILAFVTAVLQFSMTYFEFPQSITPETNGIFQIIIITFIAYYGGARGKGDKANREKNTLGLPPGTVRLTFGVLFFLLALAAFAFNPSSLEYPLFLLAIFGELVGIAIPTRL